MVSHLSGEGRSRFGQRRSSGARGKGRSRAPGGKRGETLWAVVSKPGSCRVTGKGRYRPVRWCFSVRGRLDERSTNVNRGRRLFDPHACYVSEPIAPAGLQIDLLPVRSFLAPASRTIWVGSASMLWAGPGWPRTVRTCGKSPGIASAARCRMTTRSPVITRTAKAGKAVTLKRGRRPGDRARAAPPIAGVCCRRLPAHARNRGPMGLLKAWKEVKALAASGAPSTTAASPPPGQHHAPPHGADGMMAGFMGVMMKFMTPLLCARPPSAVIRSRAPNPACSTRRTRRHAMPGSQRSAPGTRRSTHRP